MALPLALPRFILLKSAINNKFLRYRKEKDAKHACLQFSQDESVENAEIQFIKFEVQESQTLEGFVHIRSCYNNKYWVRKWDDEGGNKLMIVAEANEPEEDPSKLSCTLFKPVVTDEINVDAPTYEGSRETKPQKIKLTHIDQLGEHACVTLSNTVDHDLVISDQVQKDSIADDMFVAYNATFLLVLPDRVAFTADNEKYGALSPLKSFQPGEYCLEFKATDMGTEGVTHAVTQLFVGQRQAVQFFNTALSSTPGNGRWRHILVGTNENRIVCIEGPTAETIFNLFPIRLGSNQIALNYGSFPGISGDLFANSVSGMGMDHVLGFTATSINNSAILTISEPIRFRQLADVNYDLRDSRVYNVSSVEKFRDVRSNNTSVEQAGSFGVEYTVSQSMTWGDSITLTRSLAASMSASIPFVGISFGVELSDSTETSVVWGSEEVESRTVSYGQDVVIPPGKKLTLVVVASRAQCDVPFTCKVHEVVADGNVRQYTKTDGLYTGVNEFSFETGLFEEDI